ncbi:rhamnogalacturonan acetylesterase [Mucilaginibacter terrae]|uniref:Lysophospholipase L1-like esterase n=1 Tax=Mucilaginibacter terrae TaxID=1955052 RepID=A0ABU3GWE3_9SPHI|nr:rhamnogalacturonan acetylesterase [Mucilaginibacter terrae]MDT3404089.1 lysophospholipase L1-like esterase [Mucilaginibacter terrae]
MRSTSSELLALSLTTILAGITLYANAQATSYKFDFGTSKVKSGFTQVKTDKTYIDAYGFDFGTTAQTVPAKGKNSGYITADKPFYFSVNVPEGNYKVTLTLGGTDASLTTVKAESRRLMLEKVATQPGETKKVSFIVNVRKPEIGTTDRVKLKPRENGKLDWDDKLTLEFDEQPSIAAMEIEKVDNQITVYLAGNSTVVDQDDEPWAAWGQMIPRFFKPGVAIANHAESGLTLGSFMGSKRLDKVMSTIKPGDYLFIEFGHNDQKEKGPNDGPYKSYTERFKTFIGRARAKGAIPVIVTSTSRRSFDADGKTVNTLGDYPAAARKIAEEEKVTLIDLNAMTAKFYDAMGVEPSKKAFVHYPANTFPGQDKALEDNTHFNPYGAYELAKCIVEGIKASDLKLKKYLVDIPAFDPSHPDAFDSFSWPMSPKNSTIKPDGN